MLDRILKYKKEELEHTMRKIRMVDVRKKAEDQGPARDFISPLSPLRERGRGRGGASIIAEIKKASPSAGVIRENYDPAGIAISYEENGAAAISVLTDEHFFQGSLDHIRQVKQKVALPVLRKDFVFDLYQIYEARGAGADAVLLVVRLLQETQLKDYADLSRELGMTPFVEVHDEKDLDRISRLSLPLVGINNRDLDSLKTDLSITEKLAPKVPRGCVIVSESGIHGREDIERMEKIGVTRFLIGETLLRERDPGKRLAVLLKSS